MKNSRCKLHFGGQHEPCGSCIPYLGFRIAIILIAGVLMGTAGLLFVEDPPASLLLQESATRATENKMVLQKLRQIENLVTELKFDVVDIKKTIETQQ